jgi:hypothetical protein
MSNFKVLLFFFVPLFLQAQPVLKVSRQAQMVYSKYDHCYMVFDDSTHYYTYNPKVGAWRMHSIHMELEPNWDLPTFKQRFYPLAIGKKHYLFVMDGCGMVYELKNDTLRRIDNSYDQKNQFGSALYAYRGEPYMFAGYGLFEVKNTHTYFDFAAKEWFEVSEKTSGGYPEARNTPYFIQTAKDLFVLGGVKKSMTYNKILQDIWRFDLQKKQWEALGELNPDFVYRTKVRGFVQNKDYRIFHSHKALFQFAREWFRVQHVSKDSILLQVMELESRVVKEDKSTIYMKLYADDYIKNVLKTDAASLKVPTSEDSLFIKYRAIQANSNLDSAFAARNPVDLSSRSKITRGEKIKPRIILVFLL